MACPRGVIISGEVALAELLNVIDLLRKELCSLIEACQNSFQENVLKLADGILAISKKTGENTSEVNKLKILLNQQAKTIETILNKTNCSEFPEFYSSKKISYITNTEISNRAAKLRNLILFGLPDSSVISKEDHLVEDIMQDINIPMNKIVSFKRLGQYKVGKCRPVIIVFDSTDSATLALRSRFKLPSGIYLSRDKTKLQRETYTKLKLQVDAHNAKNTEVRKSIRFNQGDPYVVELSSSSPDAKAILQHTSVAKEVHCPSTSVQDIASSQKEQPKLLCYTNPDDAKITRLNDHTNKTRTNSESNLSKSILDVSDDDEGTKGNQNPIVQKNIRIHKNKAQGKISSHCWSKKKKKKKY